VAILFLKTFLSASPRLCALLRSDQWQKKTMNKKSENNKRTTSDQQITKAELENY
jgi:hypothetical protein